MVDTPFPSLVYLIFSIKWYKLRISLTCSKFSSCKGYLFNGHGFAAKCIMPKDLAADATDFLKTTLASQQYITVADPGFPVGGGGRGRPTWALFGENVCKNERIGSHRGGMPPLDPPIHQAVN